MQNSLFFLIYLLLCHLYCVTADKPKIIEFNVTSTVNSEGRRVISINNQLDTYGPTIRVRSGEELRLKVNNYICSQAEIQRMGNEPDLRSYCETSLHFHGIINVGNQFDGVPGVTQDPIQANGGEYWYNFTVPNDLCGTFWYHSHSSVQYGDGLRGVMIIECDNYEMNVNKLISNLEQQENLLGTSGLLQIEDDLISKNKIGYEELIVTLSDWYNRWNFDINRNDVIDAHGSADPRLDDSIINGKKEIEQTVVIPDHREYLVYRFINTGMSGTQVVNFPGYKMVVFETDGVIIKPYAVDTLSMAVGQRYSVIIRKEPNAAIRMVNGCNKMMGYFAKQVWYVPKMNVNGFELGALQIPPINRLPGLDKHELFREFQPLEKDITTQDISYFERANVTIELDYDYYKDDKTKAKYGTGMFLMNGKSMAEYLEEPIQLPEQEGTTVDIIINSIEHMRHPWHLHGHRFQVLSMGLGGEGKLSSSNSKAQQKYQDDISYWQNHPEEIPMTRDSINIPGRSFAVLRIKTKDYGKWLLHCHVEWHVSKGLGVMFENKANTQEQTQEQSLSSITNPSKRKVLTIYAIIMLCIDIALFYVIMK
ncbi:Uncharacterized protein RNJ44_00887 [Nakaseomyces bracarensis]|uniref:Multicopper oxidase n=1 Tax=Nakaseomyces bracarensis TaxID=273131 RepID=A0ABR4NQF6_9SACH